MSATDADVSDVPETLSRVTRAVSIAWDATGRVIGWYRAAVDVAQDTGAIRWHERGVTRAPSQTPAPARRTPARNAQVWRTDHDELILEHARTAVPVCIARFPLCQLDQLDPLGDAWTPTTEPHPCDRDLYIAAIRFTPRAVELDWTVRTPRGDERILARYRF